MTLSMIAEFFVVVRAMVVFSVHLVPFNRSTT